MENFKLKSKTVLANCRGIGFSDFMVLLSIVCALGVYFAPMFLKPQTDLSMQGKAESDLMILSEAIKQLERHSGILAGYPGPNRCINDMEFESLEQCRLGLACNDGKYPIWNGPYVKEIPLDPWGRKYYLDNDYYQGKMVSRVLGSKGPNGVQDYGGETSDDVIFVLCSEKNKEEGA